MPGFDRISELPESLITEILFKLPTKDSVKTSVLSTRWKNLWLKVARFDLKSSDFPYDNDNENAVSLGVVVKRFVEFNPESRLQVFKVAYNREMSLRSKDLIRAVVNRGVQHLDVESNLWYRDDSDGLDYPMIDIMPLNLCASKTLVSLKLSFSGLDDSDSVSMPCLKFMHLHQVRWRSAMHLEKLVSACPLLEELIYVRAFDPYYTYVEESVVTRVTSRSLKRFSVLFDREADCRDTPVVHTFEIDAPGLEYMSLVEDQFDRYLVKNLTSLSMIDLNITFVVGFGLMFDAQDVSKRNEISDFLTGISSARHMIISNQTVKALELYSKVGLIPKFKNISRLEAGFPCILLQFLPAFLECFSNLKHLILTVVYPRKETNEFKLVTVPQCFVSTLECVEVNGLHEWEEDLEKNIAFYFLDNSAVLKKLRMSFLDFHPRLSNSEIWEELNKRTGRCQITVCDVSSHE